MKAVVRLLLTTLPLLACIRSSAAEAAIDTSQYVTVAADGLLIPDPFLGLTTVVQDGSLTHTIPLGTRLVPDGSTDAFAIGRYEVTNAEWLEYVVETGAAAPRHWSFGLPPVDRMNHPVVWITWAQAAAYCQWLSTRTGLRISLPTEAQWEAAARASRDDAFPWGDAVPATFDAGRLTTRVNYNGVTAISALASYPTLRYTSLQVTVDTSTILSLTADGRVRNWRNLDGSLDFIHSDQGRAVAVRGATTPVGSHPDGQSPRGIHDLAGNAAEWLASGRVRGGSWQSPLAACRNDAPSETPQAEASSEVGFRIVCNLTR